MDITLVARTGPILRAIYKVNESKHPKWISDMDFPALAANQNYVFAPPDLLAGQSKSMKESRATSEVRRCMNQGLLGRFRLSAHGDLLWDYLPDSEFEQDCCSLFPFLKAASTHFLYK